MRLGTVDNRSQPMPYTSNNNSNNDHGLDTISNNHILVVALQRLIPPECRFPYWPATAILTPFTGTSLRYFTAT